MIFYLYLNFKTLIDIFVDEYCSVCVTVWAMAKQADMWMKMMYRRLFFFSFHIKIHGAYIAIAIKFDISLAGIYLVAVRLRLRRR